MKYKILGMLLLLSFNVFAQKNDSSKKTPVERIPSDWTIAVEIFRGKGSYTQELREAFTDYFAPIEGAVDVGYKNITLYLRYSLASTHTQKPLTFNNIEWEDNLHLSVFMHETALGYQVLNARMLKLAPFVGFGSHKIQDTGVTSSILNPEPLDASNTKVQALTYSLGLNLDFNFSEFIKEIILAKPHSSDKTDGFFFRTRYAYNLPQFSKKYEGLDGNFHSLTIGFGISKRINRKAPTFEK